ncbi:MAG TPA: caspase family protein, partial [Chloroflexia bacterium]|nr:caspase family protein [Chloroflexia bacterium]
MMFTNGYALLVGVDEYRIAPPGLTLPIARNDAYEVARVLVDEQAAGYPKNQVTLLTGETASRSGILRALDSLKSQVSTDSTVLIFLCGHGVVGNDGSYYFLCHDTQFKEGGQIVPGSAISSRELTKAISAISADRVLLLLNSNFSGNLIGDFNKGDIAEPDASVLRNATSPAQDNLVNAIVSGGQGRAVISASRANQQSYFQSDASNTIFTQALVEGLRGSEEIRSGRGYIDVFLLYQYIFERVRVLIRRLAPSIIQEPVLSIQQGVGSFPVALYRGGRNLLTPDTEDASAQKFSSIAQEVQSPEGPQSPPEGPQSPPEGPQSP